MMTRLASFALRHSLALPLSIVAMTVALTGVAAAQTELPDVRWQPWLGCWTPVDSAGPSMPGAVDAAAGTRVCVVTAPGGSAVDLIVVREGTMVTRQRVNTNQAPRESVVADCLTSDRAEWSADGRRVYLRSGYQCPGGVNRSVSSMFALTPAGEWLDVSSVTMDGSAGLRIVRYRPADDVSAGLPPEVTASLRTQSQAIEIARTAAGASPDIAAITDTSRHVSAAVVETWLTATDPTVAVTADTLRALVRAGVPGSTVDVLVGLAYPRAFSVRAAEPPAQASAQPNDRLLSLAARRAFRGRYLDGPWFGYGGYADRYGTWYPGSTPTTVVVIASTEGAPGPPSSASGHGQVVNGRGYSQGRTSGESPAPGTVSAGSGSASAPSGTTSSPDSSPAAPSGSSPSTSDGERTAHPR